MRRGFRALACALLGVTMACSGQSEPTRLVLVTDTNIEDLEGVRFFVTALADGATQRADAPIAPGEPAWLVMEKSKGASLGPYKVHVVARKDDVDYAYRDAQVSFVPGRTMMATLHVAEACRALASKCEQDGEVCAEGKCRGEELSSGELSVWDGELPHMAPVDAGVADAGIDAGMMNPDEDAGTYDAGVSIGDTCIGVGTRCAGPGAEAKCENGVITRIDRCEPSTGTCAVSRCDERLRGCTVVADDEGEVCGSNGLVCRDLVCGKGQTCSTSPCAPACDADVFECELRCGSANNCSPNCPPNVSCTVECGTARVCAAECRGDCVVNCTNSRSCSIACRPGSRCNLNCSGNGCDKVDCMEGAKCYMGCNGGSGGGGGCMFRTCEAGQMTCPNGLVVCNADC